MRRCSACSRIRRSNALVSNFAGQWLFLRNLQSARPDGPTFPNFDDNLRQAYRRETEMLFESIMRENRSVVDLLNANYTFVNERLARQYGIPNVYGSQFRRVTLTDPARFGLAWTGQRTDGNLVSESDLAGAARQMDHGKHHGHAAAGAPAGSAASQGKRRRREAPLGSRTDGTASRKSSLRDLPCGDGSAGLFAREF